MTQNLMQHMENLNMDHSEYYNHFLDTIQYIDNYNHWLYLYTYHHFYMVMLMMNMHLLLVHKSNLLIKENVFLLIK